MSNRLGSQHDEVESLVAAYVLGAVEPDEQLEVQAHLEGCAECRELEKRLARAVGALGLASDEAAPPKRLREAILQAAAGGPQVRVLPLAPRRPARPRLRAISIRRTQPWLTPYAAAAVFALAVLGLGAWNLSLAHQLDVQRQQTQALKPTHAVIAGQGSMAGSTASVVTMRPERLVLVSFQGLRPLPKGKVYEIWLGTATRKMVPAGVFTPDPDGSRSMLIDRDISGYSLIAVTVEDGPAGSIVPTTSPGLLGNLA